MRIAHRTVPRLACLLLAALCAAAAGCERGGRDSSRVPAPPADLVESLNAGAAAMGRFDFRDAETTFARALAAHPGSRMAKLDLAISILNQSGDGAQERALSLLRELISAQPGDARAEYCAGLALLYLGMPQDALGHFRRAADAVPSDAHAAYYTAQCLEQVGDGAQALPWYERAAQLDPLLRSAQLGIQRIAARAGDSARAEAALARFEELARSPRSSIAEFKYTRMGALGEVVLPDAAAVTIPPEGPAFAPLGPMPLDGVDRSREWLSLVGSADLDGDGLQDLIWERYGTFNPGSTSLEAADRDSRSTRITLGTAPMPRWTLAPGHPLEQFRLQGALWGDIDSDTYVDAVIAVPRADREQTVLHAEETLHVIRRSADGAWLEEEIATTEPLSGDVNPWMLADLDHDGDLDIVVDRDGSLSILYNRLDGTFEPRDLPADTDSDGGYVRAIAAIDADQDGDLDLVCTRGQYGSARTTLLLNDQLWRWRKFPLDEPFSRMSATAMVGYLRPGDGSPMIACLAWNARFGSAPHEDLEVWDFGGVVRGGQPERVARTPIGNATSLAVADIVGSGQPSILVTGEGDGGVVSMVFRGRERFLMIHDALGSRVDWIGLADWRGYGHDSMLVVDGLGVAVVPTQRPDPAGIQWVGPGPGRLPLATVSFRGRTDPAQQMRTNASGIGTRADVRVSGEWIGVRQLPWSSTTHGPVGQSLEPVVIGFGGATRGDFMRIDWPDGVMQTEAPVPGGSSVVTETQRQISSCPVIFAWNGAEHRFVTDCLGVGGIGYLAGVSRAADGSLVPAYPPPRPRESVVLGGADALAPRIDPDAGAVFDIRLGEPMEEACYLDAARLVAWDLPAGWSMTLDERMGIGGQEPTGAPIFYRDESLLRPIGARDAHGRDLLGAVARADLDAADPGAADPRFIGRLGSEFTLECTFSRPLAGGPGDPVLVMDGWVEYPYSTTGFAMWQADAAPRAPTIEALDPATGQWVELVAEYGYPAGMPRQCAFPLPHARIPVGAVTLRLRTTQELYVDAVHVAYAAPCPEARRIECPLVCAEVADAGFASRATHAQRRPDYNYARRAPLWDCRTQPGAYTDFLIDCSPLVASVDDACAIFAAGEEIRLLFGAGGVTPVPEGTRRRWILEVNGWCKDMDPLTRDGARLLPLPARGNAVSEAAMRLMGRFNSRIEGGRD